MLFVFLLLFLSLLVLRVCCCALVVDILFDTPNYVGECGTAVAVKVQRKGVDFQMRMDLVNFSILLELLHRFEPDQDWRPVVSEWSAAVRLELDFVREAQNLREVSMSLSRQ